MKVNLIVTTGMLAFSKTRGTDANLLLIFLHGLLPNADQLHPHPMLSFPVYEELPGRVCHNNTESLRA